MIYDDIDVDYDDDNEEPNDTGCPLCFSDESEVEWGIKWFDKDHNHPVPTDDKWAHCNKCNRPFKYVG